MTRENHMTHIFGKMVSLVDRMLDPKFLKEIQCHYDSKGDEKVEMTLEKL
jgi:hypothetical protein